MLALETITIVLLAILGCGVLVIFWGISIYNGLVKLKNRFQNAWSQIDVQLKRRYDLIPNLVETAKGYLSHEKETLEAVISARAQAVNASQDVAKSPGDVQSMDKLMTAEASLTGALGRLMMLTENYPELKGNESMNQVMEELTTTENKVSFARQAYNDSVMEYNTSREMFPNVLIAGPFNFDRAAHYELTEEDQKEAPKVSFN